jgi:hypothetical protein
MRIVEYADAYYYIYGIALYKYKRTTYVVMQLHFKTMTNIDPNSKARINATIDNIITHICNCPPKK